jgi:hypothetical protein
LLFALLRSIAKDGGLFQGKKRDCSHTVLVNTCLNLGIRLDLDGAVNANLRKRGYADDVVSGHRQCGSGEPHMIAMAAGIALMLTLVMLE